MSCRFIQSLFKINLWFLSFVINNEIKFFRCLFTVMIKYMTCVTVIFDLSSNSRINLSFNNCWNAICNFSQIFYANFSSMKACFVLSMFNKSNVLSSSLFFNLQTVSNARSLNKFSDRTDADINRIFFFFSRLWRKVLIFRIE